MKRISWFIPIAVVANFVGLARAEVPTMASAQGMGDTTRSSGEDGGAVYTAPATVWLNGGFDVSAGARLGTGKSRVYQVSALDAQTGPVALGLSWFRHDADTSPGPDDLPGWKKPGESLENPTKTSVFAATLGGGGVHHLFSVAVGLRYYTRMGPVTGNESEVNAAFSIGGIVRDQLTLTLTAENLIPQDGFEGAPLGVGTGTRWQPTDDFGIAFDTFTDFESLEEGVGFTPMLGAEYAIAQVVPVRLGWTRDGVSGQGYATAGLGFRNDTAGLSYGAKVEVGDLAKDKRSHWHGVSLRASF